MSVFFNHRGIIYMFPTRMMCIENSLTIELYKTMLYVSLVFGKLLIVDFKIEPSVSYMHIVHIYI